MYLTLPFILDHEDAATATYEEQVESAQPPVIGTFTLNKSALSTPPPPVVRIILSYHEARPAPAEPPRLTGAHRTYFDEKPLNPGDKVTVVKNRHATVTSPPEWLEQYVGSTGTVLWTTPAGAMVNLPGSRAWFPYAELEQANPDAT
jgi:hypothetical protein